MKTVIYSCLFVFASLVGAAQISIQTNMPPTIAPNSTLNIEVKISKGGILNFAKYQMDLPEGVTAKEGENKTGSFTFENGRVKIVWVSIPTEPEFIVSFVMYSGSVNTSTVINHKFFYLDNGTKQESEMDPINVKFDPSGTSWAAPLTPVAGAVVAANTATESSNSAGSNTTEPEKPASTNTSTETKSNPPADNTAASTGLVYKLQLGALGADPGKSKYAKVGKVNITQEGGFFKVLYGAFKTKEEAIQKRSEIIAKGFDCFVVAYQNGQRVK